MIAISPLITQISAKKQQQQNGINRPTEEHIKLENVDTLFNTEALKYVIACLTVDSTIPNFKFKPVFALFFNFGCKVLI